MVVCVECLPADKLWDVVSATRRCLWCCSFSLLFCCVVCRSALVVCLFIVGGLFLFLQLD